MTEEMSESRDVHALYVAWLEATRRSDEAITRFADARQASYEAMIFADAAKREADHEREAESAAYQALTGEKC